MKKTLWIIAIICGFLAMLVAGFGAGMLVMNGKDSEVFSSYENQDAIAVGGNTKVVSTAGAINIKAAPAPDPESLPDPEDTPEGMTYEEWLMLLFGMTEEEWNAYWAEWDEFYNDIDWDDYEDYPEDEYYDDPYEEDYSEDEEYPEEYPEDESEYEEDYSEEDESEYEEDWEEPDYEEDYPEDDYEDEEYCEDEYGDLVECDW